MDKIAIIDHSYHAKTKSSAFIIDLLKEHYEVDIILDDSWKEGKEPDLSCIDDSYKVVVFWQSISPQMVESLKCNNIVFFPMYDACGDVTIDYWYNIRNVKVICFSRTLHEKLSKLGFQCMYIQYFPQPISFNSQKGLSLFFWHRRCEITWETVRKLIEDTELEAVHIHKAVDPFQTFTPPSTEDEVHYNISYSDWFNTKQDYLDAVDAKSIYIAPRITEGIGFSFLEAMAMGKAVVAADRPTMNEYIQDGINGYLFSVENPRPIDFTNLEQVKENAFRTIVEGRKRWDKGKYKILDFIEEAPRKNHYFEKRNRYIQIVTIGNKVKRIIKYILPYGLVRLYQKYKTIKVTF
ncbi:hypothetical protein SCACP_32110 [Sporomusa carbonis]|uniref:glycosyltransferase n=1 Tax=Sporomusa carbonis TaxID=3076075 RepID=UPI003A5E837D